MLKTAHIVLTIKSLNFLNPKPLQSLDVTNLKIVNLGNYNNLGIKFMD